MKLWEMIKELTEDPGKKFKCIGTNYKGGEVSVKGGDIAFHEEGGIVLLSLNSRFKEIKKPVSFMEAVESGKRVSVEYKQDEDCPIDDFGFQKIDCLLYDLAKTNDTETIRKIILNGKWYIED